MMISKRFLGFVLIVLSMWFYHENHDAETPRQQQEYVVDQKPASAEMKKSEKLPLRERHLSTPSGRECLKQLENSEEVQAARAVYLKRLHGRLPSWMLQQDPKSDNKWAPTDLMRLYAGLGFAGLMTDENIPLKLEVAEMLTRLYFDKEPECINLSFIILKGVILEKLGQTEELADMLSVSSNYRCAHLDFLQGDMVETLMTEATTPAELIVAKSMVDHLPKIDYEQITDFLKRHKFSAPAYEVNVAEARGSRDSYVRNHFFENDPEGVNFRRQISEYFTPEYNTEIFDPAESRKNVDNTNWETLSELETRLSKSCSLESLQPHAESFRSSVNFWLNRKKESYEKLKKEFIDPRTHYSKR